ncbi:MAG: hypothetical protein ABSG78_17825 [Verrucomicrobiota bacterium]|jgi:hypothetical protein
MQNAKWEESANFREPRTPQVSTQPDLMAEQTGLGGCSTSRWSRLKNGLTGFDRFGFAPGNRRKGIEGVKAASKDELATKERKDRKEKTA